MFDGCPASEYWELHEALFWETLDPELQKELCEY